MSCSISGDATKLKALADLARLNGYTVSCSDEKKKQNVESATKRAGFVSNKYDGGSDFVLRNVSRPSIKSDKSLPLLYDDDNGEDSADELEHERKDLQETMAIIKQQMAGGNLTEAEMKELVVELKALERTEKALDKMQTKKQKQPSKSKSKTSSAAKIPSGYRSDPTHDRVAKEFSAYSEQPEFSRNSSPVRGSDPEDAVPIAKMTLDELDERASYLAREMQKIVRALKDVNMNQATRDALRYLKESRNAEANLVLDRIEKIQDGKLSSPEKLMKSASSASKSASSSKSASASPQKSVVKKKAYKKQKWTEKQMRDLLAFLESIKDKPAEQPFIRYYIDADPGQIADAKVQTELATVQKKVDVRLPSDAKYTKNNLPLQYFANSKLPSPFLMEGLNLRAAVSHAGGVFEVYDLKKGGFLNPKTGRHEKGLSAAHAIKGALKLENMKMLE